MNLLRMSKPKLSGVLLSLCSVLFSCNDITFSKDIAPIIHQNCTPCHNSNGGAPFSLVSFHDVKKRAKMVAFVTQTRYMPPWPANSNYSHFINERVLSEKDIQLIQDWYKSGAKPGDTASVKLPKLPEYQSVLGKPDMVISLPPISILPNQVDQFLTVKIPYQIDKERIVKAVEFVPGQKKIVHHFNGHYLGFNDFTNPFDGNRVASIESSNFASEFDQLKLLNNDQTTPERIHSAVNYLPGSFGVKYPDGIGGFVLKKNGAFVGNDIHYGPSSKRLTDSSKLYLYFTDKPIKRNTYEIMLGTNGVSPIVPPLVVPPNKISNHVSEITIYNSISVLTINPHMHLIGKSFKAFAVKPNGDTIPLIEIPKWRFQWQYFYTFKKPVKIPKGSRIVVNASFDNTSANPNNPNKPPQMIAERLENGGASMRTTDEMLQFIITYMNYEDGDENISLEP